jgi:leucyl aminopeptidase
MKINLKETIKNLKGEDLKEKDKVITVGDICSNALVSTSPKEAKEKFENYELAKKLFNETEVDLTPEEMINIKKAVNEIYGTLVVGQIFEKLK